MPDFRSHSLIKKIEIPSIKSYRVDRDIHIGGYKTTLCWDYSFNNVLAFRIYKAKLKKPLLKKNYQITDLILQRITPVKKFGLSNVILFNKSAFSQNNKVKFERSDSNRFDSPSGDISTYNFKEIGMIRANRSGKYFFIDNNIKFGETYAYALVAVSARLIQSKRSTPLLISVEDITAPQKPSLLFVTQNSSGILLRTSTEEPKDVKAFDVYRKTAKQENFEFYDRVDKFQETRSQAYLDLNVFPGIRYQYKVFTVDNFDNLSNEALHGEIVFDVLSEQKKDIPIPRVSVNMEENRIILQTFKDSDDVIGAIFERQDVWKFEKGFSQKSRNGNNWERVTQFGEEGVAQLIDVSAHKDKIYRYRVSLVKKNSSIATRFVTPHLRYAPGEKYENFESIDKKDVEKIKINNFDVEILEKKQDPILAKVNWDIVGEWNYLLLKYKDKTEKIENIHDFIYLSKLKPKNMYEFSLEVYDFDDNLVTSKKGARLVT